MPLNLVLIQPGDFTLNDNGTPGDNTSVIRDGDGDVVFTFAHPVDDFSLTVSVPNVNLTMNLLDTLGGANLIIGNLTNLATSPTSITVGGLRTTGAVTLVSNTTIREQGADIGYDIIAGQLLMSAVTGIGTASNALETRAALLEAETTTGGININNFGFLQIGGSTDEISGLSVATSGDISVVTVGTILLSDATGFASVTGGGVSSDVTLIANGIESDITSNVDNDAITASGGDILLRAGRDIGFGLAGSNFDNDVSASGSITIEAGRDFILDGFADIVSDGFGAASGGGVFITAGRNIRLRDVTGTDAGITASGNAGADVVLTTGAGGALILEAPLSYAVTSSSGDVTLNADRVLINPDSGVMANSGEVLIRPVTAGYEILLGSAADSAVALELSNGELNRISAQTLTIGGNIAGQLTVLAAISPGSTPNLVLRSGTDILIQGSIQTIGSLELRAGDNVLLTGEPIVAGGALSIFLDTLGGDDGVGAVFNPSGAISAASIAIHGADDNDQIRGIEGAAQAVNGHGGNDTLISSGEGSYFGGDGDDLVLAGLSSGLVDEILDGGGGVDTVDTRNFGGAYEINLATGATNFSFETFLNFENVFTGGGADDIVGNGAANVIDAGDGDDFIAGGGGADTLIGGLGADTLVGATGNDILTGGDGNDVLNGGDDDDDLSGGLGSDQLNGGLGIDTVRYSDSAVGVNVFLSNGTGGGGAGGDTFTGIENVIGSVHDDRLIGDGAANSLHGGGGEDELKGNLGDDQLLGAAGDDLLEGGDGNDTLSGGDNRDTLQGDAGNDILNGGTGVDKLFAGAGNDQLIGGADNDRLSGGADNDTLEGGQGDDELTGGSGDDLFIFRGASGSDVITDFRAGAGLRDVISFSTSLFVSLADVKAFTTNDGLGNCTISKNGVTIFLEGVVRNDLVADDFEFVAAAPGEAPGKDGYGLTVPVEMDAFVPLVLATAAAGDDRGWLV